MHDIEFRKQRLEYNNNKVYLSLIESGYKFIFYKKNPKFYSEEYGDICFIDIVDAIGIPIISISMLESSAMNMVDSVFQFYKNIMYPESSQNVTKYPDMTLDIEGLCSGFIRPYLRFDNDEYEPVKVYLEIIEYNIMTRDIKTKLSLDLHIEDLFNFMFAVFDGLLYDSYMGDISLMEDIFSEYQIQYGDPV